MYKHIVALSLTSSQFLKYIETYLKSHNFPLSYMRIFLSTQTGIHYKLGIISALNFPTNIHKPEILCTPIDGDNHKHNGEGSHVVEKGHFLINVSNHTVYFKVIYHHRFLSFQRICS